MNQHMTEWLTAYFDGELHGTRLQQVEQHLRTCSACQSELEQLEKLSTLIKESPPMITRTSHDQFAAQVGLRLPRYTTASNGFTVQKAVSVGWLAVPIIIIIVWAFSHCMLLIIGVIHNLGVDLSWMENLSSYIPWVSSYSFWGLFNSSTWEQIKNAVPWLGIGETLAQTLVPYLANTILTAIFLCCWMVCWWALFLRHRRPINQILPV